MKLAKILTVFALAASFLAVTPVAASASPTQALPSPESLAPTIVSLSKSLNALDKLSTFGYVEGKLKITFTSTEGIGAEVFSRALGVPVTVVTGPSFANAVKIDRASTIKQTTPGQRLAAGPATSPPLLDYPPYYGGDRIIRTEPAPGGGYYVMQCTAGGTWVNNGAPVMSTAGHCGPTGTQWQQGYFDSGTGTIYVNGTMGTVYQTEYGDGRIDAEMMSGNSYAGRMWTSSQASASVTGQAVVGMGTPVCAVGSFTGFACGRVTNVNICVSQGDGNGNAVLICGLDTAESNNGNRMVQPGDSGGPMVVGNQSSVQLAGIISGGNIANGGDGRLVTFTHPDNIATTFNVSVATG